MVRSSCVWVLTKEEAWYLDSISTSDSDLRACRSIFLRSAPQRSWKGIWPLFTSTLFPSYSDSGLYRFYFSIWKVTSLSFSGFPEGRYCTFFFLIVLKFWIKFSALCVFLCKVPGNLIWIETNSGENGLDIISIPF